ncbi:MAG: S8 family serine peptidase [bacterium]
MRPPTFFRVPLIVLAAGAVWLSGFVPSSSHAQEREQTQEQLLARVEQLMQNARAENVPLLSPGNFARASALYEQALRSVEQGADRERRRSYLEQALEHLEMAAESATRARSYLEPLLVTRNETLELVLGLTGPERERPDYFTGKLLTDADFGNEQSYHLPRAEEQFGQAVALLEEGNLEGAREVAAQAGRAYRSSAIAALETGLLAPIKVRLEDARATTPDESFRMASAALEETASLVASQRRTDFWVAELSGQVRFRVQEALRMAGLEPVLPGRPGETSGGQEGPEPSGKFVSEVDDTIRPRGATVAGEPGEPARTIVVMVHPDGAREEFVENEVILKPGSDDELREFLAKYRGRVVNDGTVPPPPPTEYDRLNLPFQPSGYYVIQVDLETVDLRDFVATMERLDFQGRYTFSSQSAMRLIALVAQEKLAGRTIQNNQVVFANTKDCVIHRSKEYATTSPVPDKTVINDGYFNAFDFDWLSDAQLQVTRAWQYVDLLGKSNATVSLAVVDRGFKLNKDFRGYPKMWGYDFVDGDYHEKVQSNEDKYHGTRAFSTAGALIDNKFGAAGTGGQVVVPLFFRTQLSSHTANAIYNAAVNWGADVITISQGHYGNFLDITKDALNQANKKKVVVLASAGNDEKDLGKADHYPSDGPWVIGVGAMDYSTKLAIRKTTHGWGSNYGSGVDIWAPGEDIDTTPTPLTGKNISSFNGTSAATPYVAGIVCLMKAIDPALDHDKVVKILHSTANKSTDSRVSPGYVNAFEAVKQAGVSGSAAWQDDSYEPNDSFYSAQLITAGKDYTATISPWDVDYFKFRLEDFRNFKVTLTYYETEIGDDVEMKLYDISQMPLKLTQTSKTTLGRVSRESSVQGKLMAEGYVRISGAPANAINCYTLRLSPGKILAIKPDKYDDGIYPNGKSGEPRNDKFADRAVIPSIVKPGGGLFKAPDIDKLNFDLTGDQDFFEVVLASATDPKTGHKECLTAGQKPYGEAGFFQGALQIDVSSEKPGVAWPFDIKAYDSGGKEFTGYQSKSSYNLTINCPHDTFKDGHIFFSVKAKNGRRNFYSVTLRYERWNQLLDIPLWTYTLPYPPVLRIPTPPFIDLISRRMYPTDPEVLERGFDNPDFGPLPAEYAILPWQEALDLDLTLTTEAGHYLEMRLLDADRQELAATATGGEQSQRPDSELDTTGRLHLPNLAPGIYVLAIGPGDFNTAYSVSFGAKPLIADDFEHGVSDRWELEPGWSVHREEDGTTCLRGEGHRWARLQAGEAWSNYAVRLRLKLRQGGIHLNTLMSDAGRYFVGLREDGLYLSKEAPWENFTTLAESDARIEPGVWHEVELTASAGRLGVYLDGAKVMDYLDDAPLTHGSIAFETLEQSEAFVDDVELVTGIERERMTIKE